MNSDFSLGDSECDDCCHLCGILLGNEQYNTNAVVEVSETLHISDFKDESITLSELRDHPATNVERRYAHEVCTDYVRNNGTATKDELRDL